jgi:hypothetical protein
MHPVPADVTALPIDVIGDVARGEHAGHARRRCVAVGAALDLDVAARHRELAFEMPVFGVWPIAMKRPSPRRPASRRSSRP